MKLIYTTYFIFLVSFIGNAHKGILKGSITDSTTNQIIVGATVFIKETNQITSSNILGNYTFNNVHPGKYNLEIKYFGYKTIITSITIGEETASIVNIKLSSINIKLNEITISQEADIGSNMQLISKIDIDLRPTKSSQDVLRMIPGLITAQHAGGGKAEQIYLRGFDIDHGTDIKLTVDGMPVNMVSHAHGQGYADLHFLTPEVIECVDFNKGPYYAQQGDFTTAGYANFKTKNSINKSMVKTEAGLFDSYRMVGLFNLLSKETKNQNAYISSEYMYTNGYFKSAQNFNRINIMGKYNGVIEEDKVVTILASIFQSKWESSGQIPDRAVKTGLINRFGAIDDKEGGNTNRANINLELTKFLEKRTTIKNQLYFVNYNFELFSNFTFFLEDSINGDQIKQFEKRNIFGYNSSIKNESSVLNKSLKTEVGFQLRYDITNGSELSHTAQRKTILSKLALGDITQTNASLYLDENIALTKKININVGARIDAFNFEYIDNLDTTYNRKTKTDYIISPKLSLVYNCSSNFQLYLKTGTGFHSNDTRVVVNDSAKFTTLPRAYGIDLGTFIKPTNQILINAAVWALDLEQEFVYVGDAAVVEPSGYTRRMGVDLSVRYQITNWLFADVDANYTNPRSLYDSVDKNYIPLAPTITSIGGLTTKFKNGLNIGLRYRHVGDRPANTNNTVVAKGYALLDGVVNYVKPKYAIGISIENIMNTQWNEAQFDTESKLKNETQPVSELHYTPGIPFFIKGSLSLFF